MSSLGSNLEGEVGVDEDAGGGRKEVVILDLVEEIVSEFGDVDDLELDTNRLVGVAEVVLDD